MKIKIDIDCSPEEARAFLGLPDVEPMQSEMMRMVHERLTKALASMDPDAMMKLWLPGGAQTLEKMQKAFWSEFGRGGKSDKS